MENLLKKIENKIKNIILFADYFTCLLINPFKFKPFPRSINRILIIDLLEIGDLIVTTPVIRALKQKYPNAEIDFLVKEKIKDVLSGNPNLNEVIPYKENILNHLRSKNYDLGVLLHPGSFKISLLLLKSNVKYRVGCTKVGIFSGKGFFLNKKIFPNTKIQHKIEDNLDVIRSININTNDKHLEIYTTKESESYVKNFFKKNKITKKDLIVVIHPGANYKTHEWFPERFAQVADYLIKNCKAKIIFTGSEKDLSLIKKIQSFMKSKSFYFTGNIKQFFSIIKNSNIVISVDTSAMHIAAAFNKKIIALFGSGDPRIWYPYTKNRIVIYKNNVCTTCMKNYCNKNIECMQAITVEDVINSFKKLK